MEEFPQDIVGWKSKMQRTVYYVLWTIAKNPPNSEYGYGALGQEHGSFVSLGVSDVGGKRGNEETGRKKRQKQKSY